MAEPAHLIHVFATFCAAGPQVRAAALMDAFGDRFRHTVLAVDGRTEALELVREARVEAAPWAPDGSAMAGIRFGRDLLRESRPDLLLTYNFGSMDAVLAARTARFDRHVHHEDGFNVDEAQRLKGRRNWARRIALRSTDVIVPSANLEKIARGTWRLPRVHLIPNGIDAARFERDAAAGRAFRAAHGIGPEEVVVGAVGHLRPVKNLGRLIRAAAGAAFPDGVRPRVVIVGDGSEREALERAAAECSDRIAVTFTGHLENLSPAYSAFDVLGISSDSEQQPISLLEAMAAGLPVAATDVGDVASTLPPEARAHVVPSGPGAERDLGVALAGLVADPERRAALGALSEERVKASFSLDGMVEAYREVYDLGLGR
ncbi:MAG: glycosyltransferase [Planctomycetota bacterium]